MNILFWILPAIALLLIMAPLFPIYKGITTGKQVKRRMIFNLCAFFGVCALCLILPVGDMVALAAPAGETVAQGVEDPGFAAGMAYLAAALVTGLSCIGAGIAVAAAAPAAIGAFSEDPKAFGKALIFVALGEGVALYGLLISILILNKV